MRRVILFVAMIVIVTAEVEDGEIEFDHVIVSCPVAFRQEEWKS